MGTELMSSDVLGLSSRRGRTEITGARGCERDEIEKRDDVGTP